MVDSKKIIILMAMIIVILLVLMQKKSKQQDKNVFTINDYNSSDGMMTTVWGPAAWHFLHTISFNYPVNPSRQQKEQYKQFFFNLGNVLPCKYCRDNYKENLQLLPLDDDALSCRESFSRWLYNLHQLVNERLSKNVNITYDEVRATYENFRSRCVIQQNQNTSIEKGCTTPFYGKKSKCVVNIVPNDINVPSFVMDPQCYLHHS